MRVMPPWEVCPTSPYRRAVIPPSALPGISPTGGEITSSLNFPPIYRFAVLDVHCLGKPVRPANLPTCGGDARQGRGGLTRHSASPSFLPRIACCRLRRHGRGVEG